MRTTCLLLCLAACGSSSSSGGPTRIGKTGLAISLPAGTRLEDDNHDGKAFGADVPRAGGYDRVSIVTGEAMPSDYALGAKRREGELVGDTDIRVRAEPGGLVEYSAVLQPSSAVGPSPLNAVETWFPVDGGAVACRATSVDPASPALAACRSLGKAR